MRITKRNEWGARPPKSPASNPIDENSTLFVHYSAGQGRGIETVFEQCATLRAIQRFHQVDRGWSDIAYSYLVFQPYGFLKRARVYEGRTFAAVPASQEGFNTGNASICVIAGPGEKLKWRTRRAIKKVYRRFPGQHLKGHRDVGSTDCPGDDIYKYLPGIARAKRKLRPFLP